MDDITFGGHVDVTFNIFAAVGATLGLNLNTTKCELVSTPVEVLHIRCCSLSFQFGQKTASCCVLHAWLDVVMEA
jgi:hypothetical protein